MLANQFEDWKKTSDSFMGKIRGKVSTAFFVQHNYLFWLRNVEDETVILYYKNSGGSPWIHHLSKAEAWLKEKEEACVTIDNIESPGTKWAFKGFSDVNVKAVLDQQPLLGTGSLPDWLCNLVRRQEGPMVALDTYWDKLRLWRCIAVHRGTRPDLSRQAARELAKSFFNSEPRQTTAQKHHSMSLTGLKDISTRGQLSRIGSGFKSVSLSKRLMEKIRSDMAP